LQASTLSAPAAARFASILVRPSVFILFYISVKIIWNGAAALLATIPSMYPS
jgi:hypothetical protein